MIDRPEPGHGGVRGRRELALFALKKLALGVSVGFFLFLFAEFWAYALLGHGL